jgi:dTDP-4-dehydrorhamnose 3,5-epimerase
VAEIRPLALDGVFEIVPRRLGDDRGYFSETYNLASLEANGLHIGFVQDNHSYSARRGTLRGLHYQAAPKAQCKLIRVVRGAIFDVAIDLRRGSSSFGKWTALEISVEKWNQILIPEGFAHGFLTLEDHTEVSYKVSEYYAPDLDRSIRFDDPDIGIRWPFAPDQSLLSNKDATAPFLRDVLLEKNNLSESGF